MHKDQGLPPELPCNVKEPPAKATSSHFYRVVDVPMRKTAQPAPKEPASGGAPSPNRTCETLKLFFSLHDAHQTACEAWATYGRGWRLQIASAARGHGTSETWLALNEN